MQDRFKSRVWDKTEKIMHYNDYVLTATGHIAKIQECSNDNSIMYFNQTDLDFEKDKILMFCTGLKDNNGKLIYEGDIVKFIRTSENKEYKGIITYDNERAMLELTYIGKEQKVYINKYQLEVIGNIYENKELLNKSEVEE